MSITRRQAIEFLAVVYVSWMGATWDETAARIGSLYYNADGSLRGFLIGGWHTGACGVGCVSLVGPDNFWVGTNNGIFSSLIHVQDIPGAIYASTAWSIRSVPKPATGALMWAGMGLLGAWVVRRRVAGQSGQGCVSG